MATLPSPRAAATALSVAGALALAVTLILWQTATRPAAERTDAAESTTAPPPSPGHTGTAIARATPTPPVAPPAAGINDADAERALSDEVRALVAAGQIGKARSRASAYHERFPNGPSANELERLTGMHPRRDATETRR